MRISKLVSILTVQLFLFSVLGCVASKEFCGDSDRMLMVIHKSLDKEILCGTDLPSKDKLNGLYNHDSSVVAWAIYRQTVNQTGWALLSVFTNSDFSDNDQFKYAGFIEGYLTYDLIYAAFKNFVDGLLNGSASIPPKAQEFVTNQTNWILNNGSKSKENQDYWNLVVGMYTQLRGMYDGYMQRVNEENRTKDMGLTYDQFYFMTNIGDLEDIIPALTGKSDDILYDPHCTILIKLLNDSSKPKLISGHNTHNIYPFLLRVFKSYHFKLANKGVAAQTLTFSSRPGDLESKDDFYFTNTRLVAMETSLETFNKTNFKYLHYDSVPAWVRCTVSMRMAKSGADWVSKFEMYRSGTHNNQWIIVDYNKFLEKATSGVVWMAEEFNFYYASHDFTSQLYEIGYVGGYNTPWNETILNVSGMSKDINYTTEPRAIQLKQYAPEIMGIDDFKLVIRMNRNETGGPCGNIAPRCDLADKDKGRRAFGTTDGKLLTEDLIDSGHVWGISSPPHDELPPFSFTGEWESVPHAMMPTTFDFPWILIDTLTMEYTTGNRTKSEQIVA